jgi:hypothetical protein
MAMRTSTADKLPIGVVDETLALLEIVDRCLARTPVSVNNY